MALLRSLEDEMPVIATKSPAASRVAGDATETEGKQKRVLFIPASIRSHIIPTLYLADLLADGYTVYYAVTNQILAEIVSENGFIPILTDSFRIAVGMEQGFLIANKKRANFWSVIRSIYTNELYDHRKQTLDALVDQLRPDIIIIDIFCSTDFLALYHHRSTVQLLFFNPMLSTYRVGSLPIVSESRWPVTHREPNTLTDFSWQRFFRNPRAEILEATMRYQWRRLEEKVQLSTEHTVVETPFTRLFKNVPELILAPLEFELTPEIRQPWQHYMGLCIREKRVDTELDGEFSQKWPSILAQKRAGKRLIYCGFGTFYTGSDRMLLDFVTNLIEAIQDIPNVQLICSVNGLVVETLKARQTSVSNVHFFKRVPQLEILKEASLHITHGGLGSVKESILYKVPMLVYPLDLHYDQNGNGLKVEYHGLGLRGVFSWEHSKAMNEKIVKLLNDETFRTNLARFGEVCTNVYTDKALNIVIKHLTTPAP